MNKQINFYDDHPPLTDLAQEVLCGLSQEQKCLPPKLFYDERGSRLFDAITELPEYYPTRAEIDILSTHCDSMARRLGDDCLLLELGSGSSIKIRLLLDALRPAAYMPMDISRDHLIEAARTLAAEYPDLDVHAACADYSSDFDLPWGPDHLDRAAFFPGSSIGNFEPAEAADLLRRVGKLLRRDGKLLIGVDLKKDTRTLQAAYNDGQNVTAEFNLNLLHRINRELDADFNTDRFSHRAIYNDALGRVEMHLVSAEKQSVTIREQTFRFESGEHIHTENSYKYNIDEFLGLAATAGFESEQVWTDDDQLFSVHCLRYARAA